MFRFTILSVVKIMLPVPGAFKLEYSCVYKHIYGELYCMVRKYLVVVLSLSMT